MQLMINTRPNQDEAYYIGELRSISSIQKFPTLEAFDSLMSKLSDLTGISEDALKTLYQDQFWMFAAVVTRVQKSLMDCLTEAYNGKH